MVGSLAKQRKFALRLKARGFPPAAIARLRTPLGAAIGAQTPEEIAVSVMAHLIETRRAGARAPDDPPAGAPDAAPAEPQAEAR
jgi:xanthine dehydrogenase accessory factor